MSEPLLFLESAPPLLVSSPLSRAATRTGEAALPMTVLPRWRVEVLSFVAPGPGGYRLLVCGLALLAACPAFRGLDGPVLTTVEWHAFNDLPPAGVGVPLHADAVLGHVHLTYLLSTGALLCFRLESAEADHLDWMPGALSGVVRVQLEPALLGLTDVS